MSKALDKLEITVYRLAQKFETLAVENSRLASENERLRAEQRIKDERHQAAVDELNETAAAQTGRLKETLQEQIDSLKAENDRLRRTLAQSAADIRALTARLPAQAQGETP